MYWHSFLGSYFFFLTPPASILNLASHVSPSSAFIEGLGVLAFSSSNFPLLKKDVHGVESLPAHSAWNSAQDSWVLQAQLAQDYGVRKTGGSQGRAPALGQKITEKPINSKWKQFAWSSASHTAYYKHYSNYFSSFISACWLCLSCRIQVCSMSQRMQLLIVLSILFYSFHYQTGSSVLGETRKGKRKNLHCLGLGSVATFS